MKILIVEDEPQLQEVIRCTLEKERYVVETAGSLAEALEKTGVYDYECILLDIMLPGLDGFSVCKRIRETPALSATRVIMLTARTQNEDIIRGLECGADDYVTKPFDRKVLLARIKAVLRRGAPVSADADFDGLVLNEDAHVARLDGEDLKLPLGEFRILSLLAANRGRVLARSRILDIVQNGDRFTTERTVDVQIANLRRKLGRWAEHIETVRGVGYRVRP